jgi:hypothetical protein
METEEMTDTMFVLDTIRREGRAISASSVLHVVVFRLNLLMNQL